MRTPNDAHQELFNQETSLYLCYIFCLFYVCVCMLHSYSYIDIHLQLQWTLVRIEVFQWATINYMKLVFVVTNIICIFVNIKRHYRYRNLRIKTQIENPIALYLIVLPLLVLSLVGLTYILAANLSYINCKITSAEITLTCVELVNLISILVLLIDTNGITDTGENWALNFSNFLTICLSLILLISILSYMIVSMYFRNLFIIINDEYSPKRSDYMSCIQKNFRNDSIQFTLFTIVKDNVIFVNCTFIILTITLIPYFLDSLVKNVQILTNTIKVSADQLRNAHNVRATANTTYMEVISTLTVSAILIALHLVFYNSQERILQISMKVMAVVLLAVMAFLTCFIWMDIHFWQNVPLVQNPNRFNQAILCLGTIGEVTVTLRYILESIQNLSQGYSVRCTTFDLVINSLVLVQGTSQSLLSFFIINRQLGEPTRFKIKRIFGCFNPILSLSALNVVFLVSNILSPGNLGPENNPNGRVSFMQGTMILYFPLFLLNRVFSTCLFVHIMR